VIPPALQEQMCERADAHVTRVSGGHLTPITHAADVTKVIVSAIDGTMTGRPAEVAAVTS
jgi:hypothetical protein